MKLLNDTNIPLSMAVWLASNTYDFKPDPKSLSATDFNKSIRQIVMRNRLNAMETMNQDEKDISSLVKSKMGTAIHDAIERTWLDPNQVKRAMLALGYPEKVIDRIKVNPNPEDLQPEDIPVYMEIRKDIMIDGYKISGKFDFAAEGKLSDFKTTGTWKWNKLAKADDDYRRQGSIYRLIHKDILFEDFLEIVFLFTDWSEAKAKADPKYPQGPVQPHKVKLWSEEETTQFIRGFIREIERHKDTPEPELPECTPDQLWQDEPTYKYYKNPEKLTRATKNFDDFYQAQQQFIKDGGVGVIKTVYGEAKACKYCPALNHCSQAKRLVESGTLKLD
ncbi:putative RecB family exonuclease [Vibrio phage PhiImVa-1]|nr:putative RecB family exonuclease [Vibrio phage PhiImVa-1]